MKLSYREEPIVVQETYHSTIDEVWKSITEVTEMRKWYFNNIEAFEPQVGFKTQFTVQVEGRVYPHIWQITEVIPNEKIAYSWKFEGYKGEGLVTFALNQMADGVQLTLTSEGLDSFPGDIPEFTRESGLAGWNYFIKESLKGYLGNN